MTKKAHTMPVVDVDQAFPAMVETAARPAASTLDQGPAVRTAIRSVLGVRSRHEDPKAFVDALTAAFRLVKVEGHVESQFVPRGYAVQADLGAVSGGQASLYRRALIARAEILRILDGLTALRTDGDADDMEAYRVIVRNAVQSLVDELGSPGGPRVSMVDSYLGGLVGTGPVTADSVGGQLGALRDRFGLVDDNVNTVEEEGLRTAFWTLVDLVADLRDAWERQRSRFTGEDGGGFLGTELIFISRLMEAASDQVEELEAVLDSVLVGASERRTIMLDDDANLTLDGLLRWLSAFLSDEGRRLAQDAGRDGVVAGLAPTAVTLAETFKDLLADPLLPSEPAAGPVRVRYLTTSCHSRWPAGMRSARVQIAVASLCRLLTELARRAQRIGRFAGVVLVDITVSALELPADRRKKGTIPVANVEFRGHNLRATHVPAFVPAGQPLRTGTRHVDDVEPRDLVRPMENTTTTDGESISALFRVKDIAPILEALGVTLTTEGAVLPASRAPVALIDVELGRVVVAPPTRTWPRLVVADDPDGLDWHPSAVVPGPVGPAQVEQGKAAAEQAKDVSVQLEGLQAEAERRQRDAEAAQALATADLEAIDVRREALDVEYASEEAKHAKAPNNRKRPHATRMRQIREERASLDDSEKLLALARDAAEREARLTAGWAAALTGVTVGSHDVDRYLTDHVAWVTTAAEDEEY